MELSNGALIHYPTEDERSADLTVTLTKPQLLGLLLAGQSDGVAMAGDASVLRTLVSLLDDPDPDFTIVTP
jgi:alkyl sulfatase BDS1-like metallo-beta-lactamase superfamily hydrolase